MDLDNQSRHAASRQIGRALISVSIGDVASWPSVDAIVNPTSRSLRLDGRVSKAICALADRKSLATSCAALAPLEVGKSGITPSFGLQSAWIVHCHGPRYQQPDAADALARTYWSLLDAAEREGLTSIAVPALSTGSLGFPMSQSAQIAIDVIKEFSPAFCNLQRIEFVLSNPMSAKVFASELHKPVQLPLLRTAINIGIKYTADEIEAMRQGFEGDQTTKWFIYYEEPWLCMYRGARTGGRCHFLLRLPSSDFPRRIEEAWVCAALPNSDYPWTVGEVEDLVPRLLDDRFKLLEISSDREYFGGASLWVKRGKVALYSTSDDFGAMLSAEQARALGIRLLSLAESLANAK